MTITNCNQKHSTLLSYLLMILISDWRSSGVLGGRPPFVFIPGDGGSQLDASLNKSTIVHYICTRQSNFFNIWLNLELLVPVVIDCWIDNVQLVYDNQTRTTRNVDGVQMRIPGFGGTETVEWVDPSHASVGAYFFKIVDALVKHGYQRNVSLKGAPYDFRKGPHELPDFFNELKTLVETTYSENQNEPVILVGHSMGALMALHFLNLQTAAWKAKYISTLVTLAGVWGGSIKSIKVYAMGDNLGSYFLSQSALKQVQVTYPSLAWLIPFGDYWNATEVLVESPTKNYTLSNLREYFVDISYMNGWEMRKDTEKYQKFDPPGVNVHCIYGTDVDTVDRLQYTGPVNSNTVPKLVMGKGDGTVNLRSLQGCKRWENNAEFRVNPIELSKVDHMGILQDPNVIDHILRLINCV